MIEQYYFTWDRILTGTTNLGQSGSGDIGNEGVLSKTRASL